MTNRPSTPQRHRYKQIAKGAEVEETLFVSHNKTLYNPIVWTSETEIRARPLLLASGGHEKQQQITRPPSRGTTPELIYGCFARKHGKPSHQESYVDETLFGRRSTEPPVDFAAPWDKDKKKPRPLLWSPSPTPDLIRQRIKSSKAPWK